MPDTIGTDYPVRLMTHRGCTVCWPCSQGTVGEWSLAIAERDEVGEIVSIRFEPLAQTVKKELKRLHPLFWGTRYSVKVAGIEVQFAALFYRPSGPARMADSTPDGDPRHQIGV